MRKFLCPVDFSEASLNAMEFAAHIGEKESAVLTLLNVFTEDDFDEILESEHIGKEYNEKISLAEGKLKEISDEICQMSKPKGLVNCEYKLRSGKLQETIIEEAKEGKYDLIVMGTVGVTNMKERYIGSKTLRVIEHAPCSVMAIPENCHYHKIKRLVYASDYQEEDKIAIQQVVSLAVHIKAHIDVLHISKSESDISKAVYQEFVNEIKSFVAYGELDFDRRIFEHTSRGILNYMNEQKSDLLVLLDKKRNFLQNLFSTSVVKELTEFSDYPFLVIKLS
ncbi:MAG TPA: hypothetical protein DDY13_01920 [Cytophagales bacterium]|jgi:nucleotide-binding universal stress UspA family protein|nr:hypothetical protein [Cytophagales bacterium]